MKESDILIAQEAGVYRIKIDGRANFEYGPPLRSLAKNLENEKFEMISVNLEKCTGMDSTFMGILAMLGLRAKKINAAMEIVNAGETNTALLKGLGLKNLFDFVDREEDKVFNWNKAGKEGEKLDKAETVVDAHDTLMDVSPENVPKFKTVVDFAKKDLENLKGKS
jgi:ABC-type transporter Mla MlaB component